MKYMPCLHAFLSVAVRAYYWQSRGRELLMQCSLLSRRQCWRLVQHGIKLQPWGGWETGGENETERECERVSVIEILTFTNVVSINVLQRRMPWMLFQNTCRKAILKNIRSVNVMFFVFFTLAQYIHQPWFIYIKSSSSAAEFKIRIQ